MILSLLACSFRTMVGGAVSDLSTLAEPSKIEPQIQISTQHYFFLPLGPSFKTRWGENKKQFSTGIGTGLIYFLPKKSKWLMNPPTIGLQLVEQHYINNELYWGSFSPFVQLTAPPICIGLKKGDCIHSMSFFAEYEYSNIFGAENEHTYTVGLYWSPSN